MENTINLTESKIRGRAFFFYMLLAVMSFFIALVVQGTECHAKTDTSKGNNRFVYKKGFYSEKISAELKKKMKNKSYKVNPNISYKDLRYISVRHYGYDGKIKKGELVVNKKIAKDMLKIFYELYQEKYPIQRMKLIDEYGGDDNKSMEANNTSAFNYRLIAGTNMLSNHAYGMAIDINPRINPYVIGGWVSPGNGQVYGERDVSKCKGKYRENMIHKGDVIYKIFKKYGFSWGGEWEAEKDYQHFEKV